MDLVIAVDAKVIALCGKIAVGKTHYAELLKRQGVVVLSCDELMLTLFDACLGERHDETVRRCGKYLNSVAAQLVKAGVTAVLDFGYWTAVSRREVRAYFEERGLPFELHYLTCEEETRLERLKKRNEALAQARQTSTERVYIVDDALLRRMDGKFEPPVPEEAEQTIDMTGHAPGGNSRP